MRSLYTASAVATGDGRNGHVRTLDGVLDTELKAPVQLGGPGGAPNPEMLFAAGYAACFHSALRQVAKTTGADVSDSEVVADVSLEMLPAGGFGLSVQLEVTLPHVDEVAANRLVQQAHQVCPYSNATRGNVEVALAVA